MTLGADRVGGRLGRLRARPERVLAIGPTWDGRRSAGVESDFISRLGDRPDSAPTPDDRLHPEDAAGPVGSRLSAMPGRPSRSSWTTRSIRRFDLIELVDALELGEAHEACRLEILHCVAELLDPGPARAVAPVTTGTSPALQLVVVRDEDPALAGDQQLGALEAERGGVADVRHCPPRSSAPIAGAASSIIFRPCCEAIAHTVGRSRAAVEVDRDDRPGGRSDQRAH